MSEERGRRNLPVILFGVVALIVLQILISNKVRGLLSHVMDEGWAALIGVFVAVPVCFCLTCLVVEGIVVHLTGQAPPQSYIRAIPKQMWQLMRGKEP